MKRPPKPLVTVYTVCHNYGRFLSQAVESVLSQSFEDWELLVIDDGSTDDTADVLARYGSHPKVRTFSQKKSGLIRSANRAIDEARGEFILRLDADDWLDENALLILSQTLRRDPSLSLVFPDYYVVNEEGAILEHVRNDAITEDAKVLDLPAHGACSLVRRSTLLSVRKYDEKNDCQDGYDLWLKLLRGGHKVKNVALPLFHYRTHGRNLTSAEQRILDGRQSIKSRFVRETLKPEKMPRVLAIVPTRGPKANPWADPLAEIAGKPLIDWTLDACLESERLERRIVVSEDADTLSHARARRGVEALKRPQELAGPSARIERTVLWTLDELKRREKYVPDFVMLLYVHTPLRRPAHIDEAVYSQVIFGTESVVSVARNPHFLYRHDRGSGMVPLYKKRLLRQEKDVLFQENGAIELSAVRAVSPSNFLGKTIGHVLMSAAESMQITGEFERWVVEETLRKRLAAEEAKK